MDLFLINGKARFRAKVQGMNEIEKRVIRHDFVDSKWHKVKIEFSEEEIKLSIDTEDTIYKAKPIALTQYAESLDNAALYVGGIPLTDQGWSYPAIFLRYLPAVSADIYSHYISYHGKTLLNGFIRKFMNACVCL